MLSFLTPWHRAIFPQGLPYSIFAAVEVNHQVRYGLVWFFYAEDTRILPMNEERFKRKTYWLVASDCGIGEFGGDTKSSALLLYPSKGWKGGQSFWFFHVVKEWNNKNRWRVPDRIDRVM